VNEPTPAPPVVPPGPQTLDPRVVTLWRVQAAIGFATFLLPLSLAAAGGLTLVLSPGPRLVAALVLLTFALSLWLLVQIVLWPPLAWERYRYELRSDDLLITSGVLFRQQSLIPRDRVQFVDTRQGPVESLFGLTRLLVFTASGLVADGGIPGLAGPVAAALRDELARRGGADGL